jgi:hypothetical protein
MRIEIMKQHAQALQSHDDARHAAAADSLIRLSARLVAFVKHQFCGLRPGGHETFFDYGSSSLNLRCINCGWRSDGWHGLGKRRPIKRPRLCA